MKKKVEQLGSITLHFNSNGHATGMYFNKCSLNGIPDLHSFKSADDERLICEVAEHALSNLFSLVNKIELADREKYKLKSTPENIKKDESGLITEITIHFSLEEI